MCKICLCRYLKAGNVKALPLPQEHTVFTNIPKFIYWSFFKEITKSWSFRALQETNTLSSLKKAISNRFTVKFVVSYCMFCKLQRDFGFVCSLNHLSGVGLTQITMQSDHPAWSAKTKLWMTLDQWIAKGNCNGEWNICWGKEAVNSLYSCKWL